MKILLSSGSVFGHNFQETIEIAKRLGFAGVELVLSTPYGDSLKEIKSIPSEMKSFIFSIHCPIYKPYAIQALFWPKKFLLHVIEVTYKAAILGSAQCIVIHPLPTLLFKEKIKDITIKSLIKFSSQSPVKISLENMERKSIGLLEVEPTCITEFVDLYQIAKNNNLFITLDTAHCLSKKIQPVEIFKRYQDKIISLHLSDFKNWQTHLPLGEGRLDLAALGTAIKNSHYNGYLVLELNPASELEIAKNFNYLKSFL